jgi:drug/metabolite transporter (DMT)-like permease
MPGGTGADPLSRAAVVVSSASVILTIGAAVVAITLRIADPVPVVRSSFGFGDIALVGFEVMGIAFASVGGLLVIRRPRNAIGWCMVVIGASYAIGAAFAAVTYSMTAIGTADAVRAAQIAAWCTAFFTTVGGILFAIGFIFPTGRGHTPRWNAFVTILFLGAPFTLAMIVLQPGPLNVFPTIENPFGLAPDLRPLLGVQFSPFLAAMSPILIPVLAWSLASRYRSAGAIERLQLKWFALAVVVTMGGVAVAGTWAFVSNDPPEIGLATFAFAGACIPIAIGIAILRHNLYDIDRIVSRTIGYAVVTAILFGVFALVNLGLQTVLSGAVGNTPIVIAASTLAVAALFNPLRRRVQTAVDRRFHRSHYDAQLTVDGFAGRLRDQLDLATLSTELRQTTVDAVEPSATGIWLRGTVR